ncbi:MAG: hypothetical protein ACI4U0_00915 [Candidatus Aphodocola sp.]
MVFKKPYGFLIKHFKLIHLILTGLYIYLAFKVSSILQYYNAFIDGTVSKLDARSYITSYYVIAILLAIIICLIVYALMKYKKKPRILYLILIAFTLAIAFLIQYSYQGLDTIYISVLDAKSMRLYRDLLQILVLLQYVSIAMVLVRGLGFDIKKFNFVQDLEDLGIDVSDEEEVELTLGGTAGVNRKIHRKVRELKYYYLENKTFIGIIIAMIIVVIVGGVVVNVEVINKEYQQNEVFSSDEFQFRVLDSYVTNKGFDNQEIMMNGTSFVIVKMEVLALHEKRELNTSNLILKVNHHNYTSSKKYSSYFIDLGYSYKNEKIGGATTYLFIYNVSDEDLDSKMKLVYAEDKTVSLNPVSLDKNVKEVTLKLGDNLDLSQSTLGSGNFKITLAEVQDKFTYPYQYEMNGQIYTNQLTVSSVKNGILHLAMEASYPYQMDHYVFLNQYGILKYKKGDQEYDSIEFQDKTPGTYKNGLYLGVDKKIMEADSIWLEITIRNQRYLYVLK